MANTLLHQLKLLINNNKEPTAVVAESAYHICTLVPIMKSEITNQLFPIDKAPKEDFTR
jgi:hypothetical protein